MGKQWLRLRSLDSLLASCVQLLLEQGSSLSSHPSFTPRAFFVTIAFLIIADELPVHMCQISTLLGPVCDAVQSCLK